MGAVLSCCATELACCFGRSACNCCRIAGGHICGAYSSIATRVGYSLLLFAVASLSWLALTDAWRSNFVDVHRVPVDILRTSLTNVKTTYYDIGKAQVATTAEGNEYDAILHIDRAYGTKGLSRKELLEAIDANLVPVQYVYYSEGSGADEFERVEQARLAGEERRDGGEMEHASLELPSTEEDTLDDEQYSQETINNNNHDENDENGESLSFIDRMEAFGSSADRARLDSLRNKDNIPARRAKTVKTGPLNDGYLPKLFNMLADSTSRFFKDPATLKAGVPNLLGKPWIPGQPDDDNNDNDNDDDGKHRGESPGDSPGYIGPIAKWWLGKFVYQICKSDGRCYGELAVYRLTFSLVIFHLILAVFLYNVKSSKDIRSYLQNGLWAWKLLGFLGMVVLSFWVLPNSFFIVVSKFFQLPGAIMFIMIQLILLIDFAYSITNILISHYEEMDSKLSAFLLLGITGVAFIFTCATSVVNFIYFGFPADVADLADYTGPQQHCRLNQFFVIFNFLLAVIVSVGSILPAVQESNPRSGLAQAAMVVVYATYLLSSALISEPWKSCNPFMRGGKDGNGHTPTRIIVYGAVLTFIAIAYSTTRSASSEFFASPGAAVGLGDEDAGYGTSYSGMDVNEPLLGGSDGDDEDGSEAVEDDEKEGVQYSYTFFHVTFLLAACYIGMLVTNWNQVKGGSEGKEGVVVIGRSMWAVWVKVVSSWVVLLLYGWSLVAPLILTDRIFD